MTLTSLMLLLSSMAVETTAVEEIRALPSCPRYFRDDKGQPDFSQSCISFLSNTQNFKELIDRPIKNVPSNYDGMAALQAATPDRSSVTLLSFENGAPCGEDLLLSLVGFSSEGYPLIATEDGIEEIISPDFSYGYEGARITVDKKTGMVDKRYFAPHDNEKLWEFFFTPDDVFLRSVEGCYYAPYEFMRTNIKSAPTKCDSKIYSEKVSAEWALKDGGTYTSTFEHGLIPATIEEIEIARAAVPEWSEYIGRWFDYSVSRIADAETLVIDYVEPCT